MKKKKINIWIWLLVFIGVGGVFFFVKKYYFNTPKKEEPSSQVQVQEEKPSEENQNVLPEGFDFEEKSGGKLSGFFFLKDIIWGKHEDYERVVIVFEPKDKNPLPYYVVSLKDNQKNPLPESNNKVLKDLGDYRLEVSLSDISAYDINKIPPQPTYTKGDLNIGSDYINKIKVYFPPEDNTLSILIGLKDKIPFKVFTLQNPSRLVIDLKK